MTDESYFGGLPSENRNQGPQLPLPACPEPGRFEVRGDPMPGGMGIVYRAFDQNLGRQVAIKRIRGDQASRQSSQNRFAREAQALVQCEHPHVIKVYDLNHDQIGPYIVMQWVDGQSLAAVRKEQSGLPPQQVVGWMVQVCEGLQAIHQLGLVHRDVKPANILLDADGKCWLIDFGLVRDTADAPVRPSETQTNAELGTLEFVAPEQLADAREASAASDQFSTAATLYQLITGFSVRARDDELLPPGLRPVVQRALKPRPVDRYPDMAAFASALRSAVSEHIPADQLPVTKPPAAAGSDPQPASPPHQLTLSIPGESRVERMKRIRQELEALHEDSRQLAASHCYAEAAAVLEQIPEEFVHLRDAQFFRQVCVKRDRLMELREAILPQVDRLQFRGLRPLVNEFLQLNPQDQEMQEILSELPKAPPRPPSLLVAPFDSQQAAAAQEAWAKHLGVSVEVSNSLGMKFRVIPPGTFEMGSPKSEPLRGDVETLHKVTITQPKLLGVYPVTQGEWTRVMGSNPSDFKSVSGQDTSRFPVESVSWEDCQEFLRKLNAEHGLEGFRYRLPTEAEWEYACRAGTVTPFWFGSELNGQQANCNGNSPYQTGKGPYLERPSVVGSYGANPFGVYDQHGQVWEWCGDWYDGDYYSSSRVEDPQGGSSGSSRVLRGGSWSFLANFCRSARRSRSVPSDRSNCIGFRVLCELS